MEKVWLYSLLSVALVSVISLVGIFTLSIATEKLRKVLFLVVSFSAGVLIGDAFIHLLPELVEEQGFGLNVSMSVIAGIAFFFIVEKVIHWRHCHHITPADHVHTFAKTNLVGDVIHNAVDGLIIGSSYLVSLPVGLATTVAVLIHEIPQEVSDFGVLLHGGYTKKKALWLNFLVSLTSVVGVLLALLIGSSIEAVQPYMVGFAAGAFIYIASADLIPELHKEVNVRKSIAQFCLFMVGIFVMMSLLLLE